MKIARILRLVTVITLCCLASPVLASGGNDAVTAPAGLQEKIISDPGIMALITPLQDDPEVRALLADPKVLEAVQAGDYGALLDDPRIRKVMDSPQVREIEQRLQPKNPGAGP